MKPTADSLVNLYEERKADKFEQELSLLFPYDLNKELHLIERRITFLKIDADERFKLLTYEQNLKRRFNLI